MDIINKDIFLMTLLIGTLYIYLYVPSPELLKKLK